METEDVGRVVLSVGCDGRAKWRGSMTNMSAGKQGCEGCLRKRHSHSQGQSCLATARAEGIVIMRLVFVGRSAAAEGITTHLKGFHCFGSRFHSNRLQ